MSAFRRLFTTLELNPLYSCRILAEQEDELIEEVIKLHKAQSMETGVFHSALVITEWREPDNTRHWKIEPR